MQDSFPLLHNEHSFPFLYYQHSFLWTSFLEIVIKWSHGAEKYLRVASNVILYHWYWFNDNAYVEQIFMRGREYSNVVFVFTRFWWQSTIARWLMWTWGSRFFVFLPGWVMMVWGLKHIIMRWGNAFFSRLICWLVQDFGGNRQDDKMVDVDRIKQFFCFL